MPIPPPSKDYRFSLKQSVSSKEVAAQIRQTIGLRDDRAFNIKWLDIEGEALGVYCVGVVARGGLF